MRLLTLLALSPFAVLAQRSDHELRGRDVAIYNLVGELRVGPTTGSVVRVAVTRRGADASRLRIESGNVRGSEALRVIYPDDRIVYRGVDRSSRWFGRSITRLSVRSDGTFGGDWGRDDRVEIVTEGRGLEAWADLAVEVPAGQRIDLHLAVGTATVENVNGDIRVDVHAASLTTRGTKGRLDLDTGSGDVTVRDADGEVTLDTGSGDVVVEGMRGPSLRMDTGSGSLRVTDATADKLTLDAGSGRVELRRIRAQDLTVDTGSGGVEIELLSDVDDLRVDTGSGGVTLSVPQSLGAELSIAAGSGGIDLDLPVSVRRTGRHSVQGTLGDGRGRIQIETGSGGVRLRPTPAAR
jgi:DUF4097 and DUF4098 domain-containing protein YvlB